MRKAWNKGLTKETHTSVAKISRTFKNRGIDNFAEWRKKQPKSGDKPLRKNEDLAELLGAILGDGYIGQHERTQVLRIVSNSNNPGFIDRYARMVERVFDKEPRVSKRKSANCVDIVIYQNDIANRLGLQTGSKTHRKFELPEWIARSMKYKLCFLRGLYETDGSVGYHERTYTHKFIFSNANQSLLDLVFVLLCELNFHPTKTARSVQLSRKTEVAQATKLVGFRRYT